MALHALMYCERLFYLAEIEEIRGADASVYSDRSDTNSWRLMKGRSLPCFGKREAYPPSRIRDAERR